MLFDFELIYRPYTIARRIPHTLDKVCFIPLKYDTHVVWDVHRKFLQYHTAPPLPGKILHVINRRPSSFESLNYRYFSELENLFSLLPREILKSKNYTNIQEQLKKALSAPEMLGIIFQSQGAFAVNERWIKDNPRLKQEIITTVPGEIENRPSPNSFNEKNQVKFLVFASRYHEKGLHILIAAARNLIHHKNHYKFTLVTPQPVTFELPNNIQNLVLPKPTLKERRLLYTQHDYIINLSLGDSLGVFLDSLRFGTPMIGYFGQHGSTYSRPNTSIMLESPIFIYGPDFLQKYNMFEYENYLKNLEDKKFFERDKQIITDVLLQADNFDRYRQMVINLNNFAQTFSANEWEKKIRKFYNLF